MKIIDERERCDTQGSYMIFTTICQKKSTENGLFPYFLTKISSKIHTSKIPLKCP